MKIILKYHFIKNMGVLFAVFFVNNAFSQMDSVIYDGISNAVFNLETLQNNKNIDSIKFDINAHSFNNIHAIIETKLKNHTEKDTVLKSDKNNHTNKMSLLQNDEQNKNIAFSHKKHLKKDTIFSIPIKSYGQNWTTINVFITLCDSFLVYLSSPSIIKNYEKAYRNGINHFNPVFGIVETFEGNGIWKKEVVFKNYTKRIESIQNLPVDRLEFLLIDTISTFWFKKRSNRCCFELDPNKCKMWAFQRLTIQYKDTIPIFRDLAKQSSHDFDSLFPPMIIDLKAINPTYAIIETLKANGDWEEIPILKTETRKIKDLENNPNYYLHQVKTVDFNLSQTIKRKRYCTEKGIKCYQPKQDFIIEKPIVTFKQQEDIKIYRTK